MSSILIFHVLTCSVKVKVNTSCSITTMLSGYLTEGSMEVYVVTDVPSIPCSQNVSLRSGQMVMYWLTRSNVSIIPQTMSSG